MVVGALQQHLALKGNEAAFFCRLHRAHERLKLLLQHLVLEDLRPAQARVKYSYRMYIHSTR